MDYSTVLIKELSDTYYNIIKEVLPITISALEDIDRSLKEYGIELHVKENILRQISLYIPTQETKQYIDPEMWNLKEENYHLRHILSKNLQDIKIELNTLKINTQTDIYFKNMLKYNFKINI